MLVVDGVADLRSRSGQELGVSGWHLVTQEQVNAFADATGDHQWIHTDPERASASPFGGTIAHGFLTISLAPAFTDEIVRFDGFAMGINYGLDRLRFPAPLPVGSRVRMRLGLAEVAEVPGGVQASLDLTFEREAGDKPVCVARLLARYYTRV